MNYKNLCFVFVLIVIVFFVVGFAFSAQTKQDSKINVTSNTTLNNHDNLTVKLTDSNGKAISNQEIKITFNATNGTQINKTVKTNESGEASLKLENMSSQKYDVVVSFAGNDNYNGCNATISLEIKDNNAGSSSNSKNTNSNPSSSSSTPGSSSSDNQATQNDEKKPQNVESPSSNNPNEPSSSNNNLVSVNSPLGANPLFA